MRGVLEGVPKRGFREDAWRAETPLFGEYDLRPEPPVTGVSKPSGPKIAKNLKTGLFGVRQKSP